MSGALRIVQDGPEILDGPAAPPWPHQPTVEWQVCGVCNYDCSYCIQSRKHRVGHPEPEDIESFLAFFSSLPGTWEIKMTGGEPFAFKGFMDRIIPGLCETPHRISTLTNLSAPPAILRRFGALTRGRLSVVSASLHLESTTAEAFLERLCVLRDAVDSNARIVVNSVLVPDQLDAVKRAQEQVCAAGFTFFPQLMKLKGGVFAYSAPQMQQVASIVGDLALAEQQRTANMAPAYTGRRCFTGARYFVLMQDGSAWSCRSAKRHGEGYLGNVLDGTMALRSGPVECPYTICPCSVPANRGMIEGIAPRISLDAEAG